MCDAQEPLDQPKERVTDVGTWLWMQMMEYCKERGVAPATQDRLFQIVDRARQAFPCSEVLPPITDFAQSFAARDVLAERKRQIEQEGWTPAHDDQYLGGELAGASACYCLGALEIDWEAFENFWPWDGKWWKPVNKRRDLVKAAALILAEIERLDRAEVTNAL